MKKEIEIKLRIDRKIFQKFIENQSTFQLERTYGFFMKGYKNSKKGIFPRIKEVINKNKRCAFVTVKIKNKQDMNTHGLFQRDEYEFVLKKIDDETLDAIRKMFFALEYPIEHIFEKQRYRLNKINNCDFVVDVLPFGYFVELEGEPEDIEKSIVDLGLENQEKINAAYLKLWSEYKKEKGFEGECIFS